MTLTPPSAVLNYLPFNESSIESSLVARWQSVVSQFADEIAIIGLNNETFTYKAVDVASNGLANRLYHLLGANNQPVIVALEHSAELIISIIGVLKANKAYIALDTTQSVGQLKLLTESVASPIVITNKANYALAQAVLPTITSHEILPQIININDLTEDCESCPAIDISPDDVAGIFFTSGTINKPKGISRIHRIILHRVWVGMNINHFQPGDCISGIRQCGLGGGVADVFNSLLSGATFCLYDIKRQGVKDLSDWLQTNKVTYFHPPIVLFRQWLELLQSDSYFPYLKQILPSGRKTHADLEVLWKHVSPSCIVLTSYSSTETTMITCEVLRQGMVLEDGVIHVGRPISGKVVTIEDEEGRELPIGEVGEVVVQSRYISKSYWNQPELTVQKFRYLDDEQQEVVYRTGDYGRLRADGRLELVGRRDSQIKLRGYRIVLDEVEDGLRRLEVAKEVAVAVRELPQDGKQLEAYFIPKTNANEFPAVRELRKQLLQLMPDYAIPQAFFLIDHFPLTSSGKINRKALPSIQATALQASDELIAPQNLLEAQLVDIWKKVLSKEVIGITDNFYDLGGDSLTMMYLMVELEENFKQLPSLQDFFNTPTIKQLAHIFQQSEQYHIIEENPEFIIEERGIKQSQHLTVLEQIRSSLLSAFLAFPLSARILHLLAKNAWFQQSFFSHQLKMIKTFYKVLDAPKCTLHSTISGRLFNQIWIEIGVLRLKNSHPKQFEKWFDVEGFHHFEQAMALGKGVILARSHGLFSKETFFILAQRGIHSIISIGLGKTSKKLNGEANEQYIMSIRSHLLFQTQQELSKGTVVSILPDGYFGNDKGIVQPFHGRLRKFQTGFVELALSSGAPIISVFTTLDVTGRFKVVFHPALKVEKHLNKQAQIESIVSQYIKLLDENWQQHPDNLDFWQMDKHLALSEIGK